MFGGCDIRFSHLKKNHIQTRVSNTSEIYFRAIASLVNSGAIPHSCSPFRTIARNSAQYHATEFRLETLNFNPFKNILKAALAGVVELRAAIKHYQESKVCWDFLPIIDKAADIETVSVNKYKMYYCLIFLFKRNCPCNVKVTFHLRRSTMLDLQQYPLSK